MDYSKHVEHFFLAGVLALMTYYGSKLDRTNEKLDKISSSLQDMSATLQVVTMKQKLENEHVIARLDRHAEQINRLREKSRL